ncbi:unnamed protein product [Rotaria socialis]
MNILIIVVCGVSVSIDVIKSTSTIRDTTESIADQCYYCSFCPQPFRPDGDYVSTTVSSTGWCVSIINESDSSYELGVAYTDLCQHVGCSWAEADGVIQWVCCCDQHLCNTGIPLPISTTTVTSRVSTRIRANKKQRKQYGPSIIHSSSRISPMNTSMKTPTNLLMKSDTSKPQETFQASSFSFEIELSTKTASTHLRTENIEKTKIYPKKWLIVIIVITILLALSALAVGIYLIIHFRTTKATTTPILKPLLRWNSTGLTVGGVGGSSGSTFDKLNTPIDLAVDFSNTLYIADFNNNRIQQWLTGALNGTTVAGQASGTSGIGAAYLSSPAGVFIDSNNNLYISDSTNARIQQWASGATVGTLIAGTGSSGSAYNQLNTPYFISRDITTNTLYIADFNNHRVMSYASGASNGTLAIGGQGPGMNNTQLNYPAGVYFDSASICLVIANYGGQHIVRWTLGVTVDPMGNLYVAGTGDQRIQLLLAGQTNGTTLAGITGAISLIIVARRSIKIESELNLVNQMKLMDDKKQFNKALELFDKHKDKSIDRSSNMILTQILKACAGIGDLQRGSTIHRLVSSRLENDSYLLASLIHLYMQCGEVAQAQSLFDVSTKKTLSIYGAMMKGYIKNNQADNVVDLFKRIKNPDEIIIILLFNACAQLGTDEALNLIKQVLSKTPKSFESNSYLLTSLLDALMKCGDVKQAEIWFNRSTKNSYQCYIQNSMENEAIELFKKLKTPGEIAFTLFFNACAQLGTEEALNSIKWIS